MNFVVKRVKVEENLTIVVLEPLNQPLFLDKEIPPGCIQHIISTLTSNMNSKETCAKMCDILSEIHMDDDNSRNYHTYFLYLFYYSPQIIF